MLHYVHQLVINCVCLLFGARQVAYSGDFGAFFTENKVKVGGPEDQNNELKDAKKLHRADGNCRLR